VPPARSFAAVRPVGCMRGLGGAQGEVPLASAQAGEIAGEYTKRDPACHTSDRMEATPPFQ
jgi:hypothetical protein